MLERLCGYSIIGVLALAGGCTHGDEKAPDSPLEYLNGQTYTPDQPSVNGVPYNLQFQRIDQDTEITGSVVVPGAPVLPGPLRYAGVVLKGSDKVLAKTTIDEHGAFVLSARLTNGYYTVQLVAGGYSAEREIKVQGYAVKDVVLEARAQTKGEKNIGKLESVPAAQQ